MPAITVLIAERQKAARAACVELLEPEKGIRIVGEAKSGIEAIASVRRLRPRIVLLDFDLARSAGHSLIPALRHKSPRTQVILLTHGSAASRAFEALAYGARGYVDRSFARTFLARAVRVVDGGEAWVPRKMVARIIDRLAALTARTEERRVRAWERAGGTTDRGTASRGSYRAARVSSS